GPGVEDLAQAAPRRRAALDDVADPAEGDERPLDALEEEHEARELADRQLAADAQDEPAADQEQQRDGEAEQELREGEQRAVDAGQGEVAAHELVVEVLEARRLAVLDPEALDDADAAEVLLRHRRDVGALLLHLLVAPVDD